MESFYTAFEGANKEHHDENKIEFNGASIEIHPVAGTLFRLGFRYFGLTRDQIPETRWEYVDPPFIKDLQILRGEEEVPIRLDVAGAGGGQGLDEGGCW